jgi:hypothetical protein
MKSLAERWLEAKEAERVAVDARRELENEMIELLAIPETLEGTRTADVGGYTVKIVGRMNRKIDADALQEIARESGLSEYLSTLFRWKPDIIAGAWKSADKTITDALSGAITTEPGRPSFSIEHKEATNG